MFILLYLIDLIVSSNVEVFESSCGTVHFIHRQVICHTISDCLKENCKVRTYVNTIIV